MNKIIRGQIISFGDRPEDVSHFEKGAIAVAADGRISWMGDALALPETFNGWPVKDHDDKILMAGFVDAHIHFPQYRMLAAPAKDLLDWLHRYTFPEEARYGDPVHAAASADVFLKRLFEHGTTSAMAFCSSHRVCAEALFQAAVSIWRW
jgi:guanine deaminase